MSKLLAEDRGSYGYMYGSSNKVIDVRWNSNSVLTLALNCQPVSPVGITKQYSKKGKKIWYDRRWKNQRKDLYINVLSIKVLNATKR